MSNEELRQAIQDTWSLIDKTTIGDSRFQPLCAHLTALLAEQSRRAAMGQS